VRFTASDVAAATGGCLVGADVAISGASFDSRSLRPGELFVPLVAERDGHDFIAAAAAAGAAATLTAREGGPGATIPAIEVADTGVALMDLARWGTRRLGATVVAITGSVGKTSTKDFAAAAIGAGRRTVANERSYNNEQGLPVTVLNAAADTDVLVLEMGMRGFGEIARLCSIAPPTVGIVTAVAAAHTERLGGIDGVAKAKAELVAALPPSGVAVLNADDDRVRAMTAGTAARVVMFGESTAADVRSHAVVLDELARPSFRIDTPWGHDEVHLSVSGRHMVSNALAAVAAAGSLGVGLDDAVGALRDVRISASRMAVHRLPTGTVIIDDAYNANPTSMRAALEALAAVPASRRVAVVGLMAELDDPVDAHASVARHAGELGVEVVAVGTDLYGVDPVADPVAAVGPLGEGVAVLVKASRVAQLDRVAADLVAAGGELDDSVEGLPSAP
jgi:UDP-N-acetylmuramoyl-tripeptide--D-alanyl-D-alanine ligase